jgi:hypothetical protein
MQQFSHMSNPHGKHISLPCNINLLKPTRNFTPPGLRGKCKAVPLQAWTGPEGSRKLRLPDFKTIGT